MGCVACAALVFEGSGITLTRKESSTLPVIADAICPDRLVGLGLTLVAALPIIHGGEEVPLGDVFDIDGAGADNVTVMGDLANVERIGQGMTLGRITVKRAVGPHLGAGMSGGEIVAERSVGDGVGAEMTGGLIAIEGSAGRQAGMRMRGGLIVVLGDAAEDTGLEMEAGTIVVGGRLGGPPGAGMKRGAIVTFGEAPELSPAFRPSGTSRLELLQPHLADLEATGLVTSSWIPDGEFRRFVGDTDSGGEGEVLVHDQPE